jgi:hypothetical protein
MGNTGRRAVIVLGPWLVALMLLCAAPTARALERPVLGTNHVEDGALMTTSGTEGQRHCQRSSPAPRGTRAIRLSLKPYEAPHGGPAIKLQLLHTMNGGPIARGVRAAGWRGDAVTIPLRTAVRRRAPAVVCIDIGAGTAVSFLGQNEPRGSSSLHGLRVEYLGAERAPDPAAARPAGWLGVLLSLIARLLA